MPVYTIRATTMRRSWLVAAGTNPQPLRILFKKILRAQKLGGDMLSRIDPNFCDELISNRDVDYAFITEDF